MSLDCIIVKTKDLEGELSEISHKGAKT